MTTIKKQDEKTILVNNKRVYQDLDGRWISDCELSISETRAAQEFLRKKINAK